VRAEEKETESFRGIRTPNNSTRGTVRSKKVKEGTEKKSELEVAQKLSKHRRFGRGLGKPQKTWPRGKGLGRRKIKGNGVSASREKGG